MEPSKQPPGRPRDGRVDAAIREAVRELVGESGYGALTMDAVAARARVGKAAIYRRHASRGELVFAALVHGREPQPLPDTGSLHGDLAALAGLILGIFSDPVVEAATPGLLADLKQHPDTAARFRDTFIAGERATVTDLLERAFARGELAERADPALVHAVLLGTAFAWVFLLGRAPSPSLAPALAVVAAAAVTAGEGATGQATNSSSP
ncbi:TetR family transcriptional regulator [Streptomyces lavendulae subsp. lavendulae]|uniref:TetR/AcrR family transcriptional regulator n=1 Tax=Streptomyces lavendulae TaxID=1914 RepID=UPI0024A3EB0E|nr:TetR/AcrR family transcriptional regulator [Streptomyces lavendulae]GLV83234.1 TetR family transcriptional regulator [Streptomyces lavendulae subsp. lavendulae]